jgi:hypothetical protein
VQIWVRIGETLLHPLPAATAVLGGIGGWDRHDSTASVCCFAFEDDAELRPPGVLNGFIETGLRLGSIVQIAAIPVRLGCRPAIQITDLQVLQVDDIVRSDQGECGLVMEVVPLPTDFLVLLGQEMGRLLAAFAPLPPASHAALRLLQLLLGSAVVPRILDDLPVSRDEKHLQADVNPRLLASWWQGLRGNVRAGEAHIPAVRFMGDGDCFDGAEDYDST